MMVVPRALISRRKSHMERRISISTPAVGSSRISSRGSCISARAIIRRRFMPPERPRDIVLRLSQSCSCFRYFSARCARQLALDAVEARLVDDDGLRRLEHVEVDFLRHDADAGLGRLELAVDVVAEHADAAGRLVHQRGDDADQRGLAGAVGTEQREEIALLDVEVDALQRLDTILVGLDETADRQRIHRAREVST